MAGVRSGQGKSHSRHSHRFQEALRAKAAKAKAG